MTFGQRIKEVCRLEKINLKEFSELSGIPYGTILNYTHRKGAPRISQLNKMFEAPRLAPYKKLLGYTEDMDYDEIEFINLFRRLKECDKAEESLDYLRYMLDRANEK